MTYLITSQTRVRGMEPSHYMSPFLCALFQNHGRSEFGQRRDVTVRRRFLPFSLGLGVRTASRSTTVETGQSASQSLFVHLASNINVRRQHFAVLADVERRVLGPLRHDAFVDRRKAPCVTRSYYHSTSRRGQTIRARVWRSRQDPHI